MSAAHTSTPPEFLKLLAHDVRWQILSGLARSDMRVQELVDLVGKPINLVSYHLKQLRSQAVVSEHRSSADGRDVYYSLDLERLARLYRQSGARLHPALDFAQTDSTLPVSGLSRRVLFLCTHNRARSQMAEGILRHLSAGGIDVHSAGSAPGHVHPLAVQALSQIGIAIGDQQSKHLDVYASQRFDYVITVCDQVREQCPAFPGQPDYIHWSIADPIAAAAEAATEAERSALFAATAQVLVLRIRQFLMTVAAPL